MARLLTAEQVCEQFGVPSPRTVRTMRQQGLAAVRLGKAYLFDAADVEAFIQAKKECPAQIAAPGYTGSPTEARSTSCGMSGEQSASALRARMIADRLKKPSRHTSANVIDLQAGASRTK
jgi:excisionase family DNA binding protein